VAVVFRFGELFPVVVYFVERLRGGLRGVLRCGFWFMILVLILSRELTFFCVGGGVFCDGIAAWTV